MTLSRAATAFAALSRFLAARPAATLADGDRAVERIRGLRFTARVNTVEIDRDLPAHLRAQVAKSLPYSVGEWGDVMRALRLIDQKDTDEAIVSSLLDLYQSQVLAYYDPPSKTFYTIRQLPDAVKSMPMGGALDAGVAVHELTHALQDQHFNIGAKDLALRDDVDAGLAYHALIEGEASLVMLAYMVEQSGGSFDEMINSDLFSGALSSAASQNLPADGPRYFVEMLKFPYLDGLRFVIEAYRRGGWKELDRVDANPPRSTREILHPGDYFAPLSPPRRSDRRAPGPRASSALRRASRRVALAISHGRRRRLESMTASRSRRIVSARRPSSSRRSGTRICTLAAFRVCVHARAQRCRLPVANRREIGARRVRVGQTADGDLPRKMNVDYKALEEKILDGMFPHELKDELTVGFRHDSTCAGERLPSHRTTLRRSPRSSIAARPMSTGARVLGVSGDPCCRGERESDCFGGRRPAVKDER